MKMRAPKTKKKMRSSNKKRKRKRRRFMIFIMSTEPSKRDSRRIHRIMSRTVLGSRTRLEMALVLSFTYFMIQALTLAQSPSEKAKQMKQLSRKIWLSSKPNQQSISATFGMPLSMCFCQPIPRRKIFCYGLIECPSTKSRPEMSNYTVSSDSPMSTTPRIKSERAFIESFSWNRAKKKKRSPSRSATILLEKQPWLPLSLQQVVSSNAAR